MELILISNTKLKIMLDESDMKKYHIGSETDCSGGTTRKAIRSLLDCARDQIGFNTDGEEIFVQLYASKRGGCELFVTKCKTPSAEEGTERVKSPVLSQDGARERKTEKPLYLPESKKSKKDISSDTSVSQAPIPKKDVRSSRLAYSFDDISSLLSVCKILRRHDHLPESRAFADDADKFYLMLSGIGMSAFSRLDSLTFILEYGKRENPDCLLSYISEHGKIICEEMAIERLCEF